MGTQKDPCRESQVALAYKFISNHRKVLRYLAVP
jgi:hypothetical protein